MTAFFHGTLADHYGWIMQNSKSDVQRSLALKEMKYHEEQYKKLAEKAGLKMNVA